jgi:hypothetical protein
VPLHIVEEKMAVVHQSGCTVPNQGEESNSDEGLELLVVHDMEQQPKKGARKPTMRFQGWIGKQQVLILVGSGSASTFIGTAFAERCGLPLEDTKQSQYTATDGGLMICDKIVPRLQ